MPYEVTPFHASSEAGKKERTPEQVAQEMQDYINDVIARKGDIKHIVSTGMEVRVDSPDATPPYSQRAYEVGASVIYVFAELPEEPQAPAAES